MLLSVLQKISGPPPVLCWSIEINKKCYNHRIKKKNRPNKLPLCTSKEFIDTDFQISFLVLFCRGLEPNWKLNKGTNLKFSYLKLTWRIASIFCHGICATNQYNCVHSRLHLQASAAVDLNDSTWNKNSNWHS